VPHRAPHDAARERQQRRLPAVALVSCALASLVAVPGCNDDGRTLRPARPDQDTTISTLPPPTEASVAPAALDLEVPATTGATLPADVGALELVAPWRDGATIDARHTCDGAGVSPALSWSGAPVGTVEIALSVVDEDAPGFVHWVVAALDPLEVAIGEGAVPELAIEATSSAGTPGYTGPCPPPGTDHRYRFTVHYLGQQTELPDGAPAAQLLTFVESASLATASTTGTYSRT